MVHFAQAEGFFFFLGRGRNFQLFKNLRSPQSFSEGHGASVGTAPSPYPLPCTAAPLSSDSERRARGSGAPLEMWSEVTWGHGQHLRGCVWLRGGWRQLGRGSEGKPIILGSSPAAEPQRQRCRGVPGPCPHHGDSPAARAVTPVPAPTPCTGLSSAPSQRLPWPGRAPGPRGQLCQNSLPLTAAS